MKKVFFTISAVVLFCGGCASIQGRPKIVILQDPKTMEFVECKVSDEWATASSFAKNDECVEDLKNKGFVVWGER